MARPRSFDPDVVLATAMLLFWEQGYEATSIRALEAATGLRAPSLYAAFGDKQALFAAALERYAQDVIGTAVATSSGRRVEGIRAIFAAGVTSAPDTPLGCLLAITSSEAHLVGDAALEVHAATIRHLAQAIGAELQAAIEEGELDATVDVPATTDAIVALHQGVQVLQRSSTDHIDVAGIAGPVLDRLLPPPHREDPPLTNVSERAEEACLAEFREV